jgi:hypothetical protein
MLLLSYHQSFRHSSNLRQGFRNSPTRFALSRRTCAGRPFCLVSHSQFQSPNVTTIYRICCIESLTGFFNLTYLRQQTSVAKLSEVPMPPRFPLPTETPGRAQCWLALADEALRTLPKGPVGGPARSKIGFEPVPGAGREGPAVFQKEETSVTIRHLWHRDSKPTYSRINHWVIPSQAEYECLRMELSQKETGAR